MSIADEITRLQELHLAGALTDAEFDKAKAVVLAHYQTNASEQSVQQTQHTTYTGRTIHLDTPPDTDPSREQHVQAQLDALHIQNALLQLDRDWDAQREEYMISGRGGKRVPSKTAAVAVGAILLLVGVGIPLWLMSSARFAPGRTIVVYGLFFVLLGVGIGIHEWTKAAAYEEAEARYEQRRDEIAARRS